MKPINNNAKEDYYDLELDQEEIYNLLEGVSDFHSGFEGWCVDSYMPEVDKVHECLIALNYYEDTLDRVEQKIEEIIKKKQILEKKLKEINSKPNES